MSKVYIVPETTDETNEILSLQVFANWKDAINFANEIYSGNGGNHVFTEEVIE